MLAPAWLFEFGPVCVLKRKRSRPTQTSRGTADLCVTRKKGGEGSHWHTPRVFSLFPILSKDTLSPLPNLTVEKDYSELRKRKKGEGKDDRNT